MAGNESAVIYVTALVIAVIIFVSGVVTGLFLLEFRNDRIEKSVRQLNIKAFDMSLQLLMLEKFKNCMAFNEALNSILEEMGKVESKLARIGNSNSLNKYEFKELRENYQLLSLKYLLILQEFPQCIRNRTVIIYFYTDNCESCENEGIILTHIKKKYGNSILVFPFDHSLNLSSIRMLESQYDISQYPTLVINGRKYGYLSKPELEAVLDGQV